MSPTPTAAEIYHRARLAYESFRTYRDEGEQTCTMAAPQLGPDPRTTRKVFRTAFVRPSNLFFEYREPTDWPESEWTHGIVCANEYGVVKWWSLRHGAETTGTLSQELGGFAGVTGRTSYIVPKLLIPKDIEDQPSLGAAAVPWIVIGSDQIDGHTCDIIGPDLRADGSIYSMWFDKESSLLRRLDERKEFNAKLRQTTVEGMRKHMDSMPADEPRHVILQAIKHMESNAGGDFVSETTTIWRPRANEEIDPGIFEFVPPKSAR